MIIEDACDWVANFVNEKGAHHQDSMHVRVTALAEELEAGITARPPIEVAAFHAGVAVTCALLRAELIALGKGEPEEAETTD